MKKIRVYVTVVSAIAVVLYCTGLVCKPFDLYNFLNDNVKEGVNYILSSIAFAGVLLSLILVSIPTGRVKGRAVLMETALTIINCLVATVIGILASWAVARLLPNAFQPLFAVIFSAVMACVYVLFFFNNRKNYSKQATVNSVRRSASSSAQVKFGFNVLYASLFSFVIALFLDGFSIYFSIVGISFAGLALWKFLKWRGWALLSFVTTLLLSFFCIYSKISLYFTHFDPSNYGCFIDFGLITALVVIECSTVVSWASLYSHNGTIS